MQITKITNHLKNQSKPELKRILILSAVKNAGNLGTWAMVFYTLFTYWTALPFIYNNDIDRINKMRILILALANSWVLFVIAGYVFFVYRLTAEEMNIKH